MCFTSAETSLPLVTPIIYQTPCGNPSQSHRETYSLSYSSDGQDARPVEVLVELASFNEFIILNVFLHLLPGTNKVIVLSIHLILSPWTSCIYGVQWNKFIFVAAVIFSVLSGYVCLL